MKIMYLASPILLLLMIFQKCHQNAKLQIALLIWCIYERWKTKVKGMVLSVSHSVSLITNTLSNSIPLPDDDSFFE